MKINIDNKFTSTIMLLQHGTTIAFLGIFQIKGDCYIERQKHCLEIIFWPSNNLKYENQS